jgi:hypothetical protein
VRRPPSGRHRAGWHRVRSPTTRSAFESLARWPLAIPRLSAVARTIPGTVVGGLTFSAIGAERARSDELTQQPRLLGDVSPTAYDQGPIVCVRTVAYSLDAG